MFFLQKKKSYTYFPTKFSSTDDFPADWPPTTAIWGKSMTMGAPIDVKASCILLIMGIKASMPRFPAGGPAMIEVPKSTDGFFQNLIVYQ